jgi:hypothetical protein
MHTKNNPPTPAAVRAAMKPPIEPLTPEENRAVFHDDRSGEAILRDHIRAVAQEMKATADEAEDSNEHEAAKYLRVFADRLEGKQNENT